MTLFNNCYRVCDRRASDNGGSAWWLVAERDPGSIAVAMWFVALFVGRGLLRGWTLLCGELDLARFGSDEGICGRVAAYREEGWSRMVAPLTHSVFRDHCQSIRRCDVLKIS